MRSQTDFFKNIDKTTILLYVLLVLIGWISIYAAEYKEHHSSILDISENYGKQLIWIITAFVLATIVLMFDSKFFSTFAYVIFGVVMLLLVAVLLFGTEVNASKSWFQIGGFRLQPAEFAKFATALAMAKLIASEKARNMDLKTLARPFMLLAIPVSLIFLQNDTGTALVFAAFILVLYREGFVSGWILILGFTAIFLFILTLLFNEFYIIGVLLGIFVLTAFYFRRKMVIVGQLLLITLGLSAYVYSADYAFENILQPHQKARIAVLIDESVDLRGAGYNLNQSKIAIGSGGFSGKGFLKGTQTKFNFVPEQGTDFIFCTVGEEWGFIGSMVLISLFVTLLVRLIFLAERQRSPFSRVFGYSLASILFFHFAINIGMTIGLVPVIGIPLPFISYGGSSLWAFSVFLFTFIKLDSRRLELF